jgi:hypothetical protein
MAVNPIYDENTNKLVATHVIVYKGTEDKYDTFISPEAYHAYEEHRSLRINLSRFNPHELIIFKYISYYRRIFSPNRASYFINCG